MNWRGPNDKVQGSLGDMTKCIEGLIGFDADIEGREGPGKAVKGF